VIPRTTFLFVVLAALPALAQQEPKKPAPAPTPTLEGQRVQSAEDVALVLERLDRLAVLEKQGTLPPAALIDLKSALLATARSVVVTGVLDDVPLPQALEAVLQAAGAQGGRVSMVLSRADREIMSALRVSATFHGARDVDAVRALLRLHESAHHSDLAYVEWSEDGGVFVIRALRLDRQPDQPDLDPTDRALLLDPFRQPDQPPALPESGPRPWLGVSWVDQNPRGPGAGGVLVTQVLPGSPAVTAGIQAGDLITGFGEDGDEDAENAVMTGDDLRQRIAGHAPGDVVIVVFVRDGAVRRVSLVLGTTPGR
jgi:hypothetical protein